MTTTPRLGAPELVSGQATPETTVNAQALLWDAFCMAHFINRTTATPPGSPAQGDCYLVASSPTGAWTGQAGNIAVYINTSWTFITPKEGFVFWVDAEGVLLIYHSGSWNTVGLSSGTFLQAANNLSDVASVSTSRTNLSVYSKSEVDAKIVGMLDVRGTTDCSANPNYPSASKGDAYIVSVAGKIGGASGVSVSVGDVYFATADNAGGTQAGVGSSWDTLVHASVSAGGGLLAANNLSDVASAVAAKDNISKKSTDIASASTTDLSTATGDFVNITGTTTITGLGTCAAGVERTVKFAGALTLTYNATSLILPTSASITTAAGDTAVFRSLGSGNWLCVDYQRVSGQALASSGGTAALTLIEKYTADGTTGTHTFSSISGSYTDLIISVVARTDNASNQSMNITVNGSSSGIYDWERLYSAGSVGPTHDNNTNHTAIDNAFQMAGTGSATVATGGEITFFGYALTFCYKMFSSRARHVESGNTQYQVFSTGEVRTTSAISSITCALAAGNFVSGSYIALYGRS